MEHSHKKAGLRMLKRQLQLKLKHAINFDFFYIKNQVYDDYKKFSVF